MDLDETLDAVGPRLRALRRQRGMTLAELSDDTGISTSTLSRLESGDRRPTLELLLHLARAYQVTLDVLVDAPHEDDPRVRLEPVRTDRMTMVPLTRRADGIQAYKLVILPSKGEPRLRIHDGYEWLYVLDGRLRLRLAGREVELGPGEAAEFDTRVPHWFGPAGADAVEVLSLFGRQGERAHLRAGTRKSVRST